MITHRSERSSALRRIHAVPAMHDLQWLAVRFMPRRLSSSPIAAGQGLTGSGSPCSRIVACGASNTPAPQDVHMTQTKRSRDPDATIASARRLKMVKRHAPIRAGRVPAALRSPADHEISARRDPVNTRSRARQTFGTAPAGLESCLRRTPEPQHDQVVLLDVRASVALPGSSVPDFSPADLGHRPAPRMCPALHGTRLSLGSRPPAASTRPPREHGVEGPHRQQPSGEPAR